MAEETEQCMVQKKNLPAGIYTISYLIETFSETDVNRGVTYFCVYIYVPTDFFILLFFVRSPCFLLCV